VRATGRIGPYEKEYVAKDGKRRWMLFVGAALDDGTIVEYVIDISARKAAEEAKRESDERYSHLFDSIDEGFCVLEMIYDGARPVDYRFLEVNPAFERQTGLRDPTRKTMREHVPEHEQHWFDTYARVAETGKSKRFVAGAKALMGGWYEVFAYRVGGAGSRKVGVVFNDITDRVLAEQALREAAQRKDEFLATLAHELRNPLAPIRNAVSILRLRDQGDEGLHMVGELIDRQVRHLVRLVDDLLDVSRITFGKVSLKRERLDLRAVAREAVATSEPLVAAGGHRLSVELGGEPVWVDGDPVRLAQVISNLLNNAARYTPTRSATGHIRLSVASLGAEACVAVEDNGVGIEPGLLDRIFEPFVQVERREAGGSGGIGIGLALAKALVQLHGGQIRAQSDGPGKGSRFVVSLPRAGAPAAEASGSDPVRAASRRFLVVDDNVDATVTQAALLRMLGHEVETANDGPSALRKAQGFRPNVVLLDLGMPGMDGFEVARRLRATPEGREVFLVAQSGWGQEEDRNRTKAAGFDAHLAKPVDVDALMGLL
jgi:signal transduction histidine kinase